MALTTEQEYVIKAKIDNLTEDVAALYEAINAVPETDDLGDVDQINIEKYDEATVEVAKREGEYGFLKGRVVTGPEEVVQADIDDASIGTGKLFPIDVGGSPYILLRPHLVDGLLGGTGQITAGGGSISGGSGETNLDGDEFEIIGVDWDALGAVINGTIDISGSPHTITSVNGSVLGIDPDATGSQTGLIWKLYYADSLSNEEIKVAAEIVALNYFTFPAPSVDTQASLLYQMMVNEFAIALDQEAIDIAGETAAWGGDIAFDPGPNNTALSNLIAFKAAMDLNSDTFITMADFQHANASTVMPPLISARLGALTITRQPYIAARESAIDADLGMLTALITEETVTGSGRWRERFDYLNFLVNRAEGTSTELKNRETSDQSIEGLIAFKEAQIEKYKLLLP